MQNRLRRIVSLALIILLVTPFNLQVFADEPNEGVDFEVVSIEQDDTLILADESENSLFLEESENTFPLDIEFDDLTILDTYEIQTKDSSIELQQQDEEEVEDSTQLLSENETLVSVGTDIVIRGLAPQRAEPFPVGTAIQFTFSIENYGSTDLSNVPIAVTVSGTLLGYANTQSLPAGTGKVVGLNLTSNNVGKHTLVLTANADRTITETSYDNNYVTGTYRWAGSTGICAYSFELQGESPILKNSPETFKFSVANLGETTVNNIDVDIYVGTSKATSLTLDRSIPPGYATGGSIAIGFPKSGRKILKMVVDPSEKISDPVRADNSLSTEVYVLDNSTTFSFENHEYPGIALPEVEHGWTDFRGNFKYREDYRIEGANMELFYRYADVSIVSSRAPWDIPYQAIPFLPYHKTSSGSRITQFSIKALPFDGPDDAWLRYTVENDDKITYPVNSDNIAVVSVGITGGAIGGLSLIMETPLVHNYNRSAEATEPTIKVIDEPIEICREMGRIEKNAISMTREDVYAGNTIVINNVELNKLYENKKLENPNATLTDAKESLLERKALYNMAVKAGFEAKESEVNAEINHLLDIIHSPDNLLKKSNDAFFEGAGMTPEQYFQQNYDFYKEEITISNYVTDLKNAYNNDSNWATYYDEIIEEYILSDNVVPQ